MASNPYLTLAGPAEVETRVLGSTFIAAADAASSEDSARAFLEERARRFHDATHNCSAWRIHAGAWRANDDGEPSGSAGAPILAAIDGAALEDCIVVVTRYFGGTKLGVGGLVRAYGEAAALALEAAPKRRAVPAVRLRIRYPYEQTSIVMRLAEQFGSQGLEYGYADGGSSAEIELNLPYDELDAFERELLDQSAGSLQTKQLGDVTLYQRLGG